MEDQHIKEYRHVNGCVLTEYPEFLETELREAKSYSNISINVKVNDIGILTEAARKLRTVRSEHPFTDVRFEVDLTKI